MKKFVAVILSVVMIITAVLCINIGVASAADSGTCGATGSDISWVYDSDTTTLTLTGTGTTANYYPTSTRGAPWDSVKEDITTVIVGEGIVSIGYCNFYGCTSLTEVSLPNTLTTISGSSTGSGYGAFRDCTALVSITLPEGLTTIGNMAFRGCTALESITFPDSLTSIGEYAFRDCTSLTTVTYGTGMTSTGSMVFYDSGVKTVNFSSTITAIDSYCFYNTKITTIEIPETVTSIGTRAFANCTFLYAATVYNANCTFSGDPFNGSNQSVTMYGHSSSTTQTYAESYSYTFVSIDDCDHETTYEEVVTEPTCTETGLTNTVCAECGFIVAQTVTAATGHTYELTDSEDLSESDGHIYSYYTCTVCGEEYTEIEHSSFMDGYYETTVIREASCTSTGLERYTCSICGETQTSIISKGHTVDSYTVTVEPTCTEEGSQEGVCTVCGETVTETIAATGHTNELTATEDLTETDGHIYYYYTCTVCGEETVELTHGDWIEGYYTSAVVTEPTCVINGIQRDTCDLCGQTRLVTIAANGSHDWYVTSTTDPTCTATGTTYYACTNCTNTKVEYTDALGHDYVVDEDNSVAPTCTTAGYNKYNCSRCSAAKTETVSATGHTAVEDSIVISSEATCTEDGLATAECSVCGESYEMTIAATGHDYVDVETEIEDKPGHVLSTPVCSVCDATSTATTVHQEWIEGYYTTTVVTEGSCTVARVTRDTCDLCGETRTNTTSATGHDYSFTEINSSGNFVYTCSVCSGTVSRSPSTLLLLWSEQYINKSPDDESLTYGYYFDVNSDDIINIKDYSIIYRAGNSITVTEEDSE